MELMLLAIPEKKEQHPSETLKTQRRSPSLAGVESFGAGATPSVPAALGRGPENVGGRLTAAERCWNRT
jgi:hypothetical protein